MKKLTIFFFFLVFANIGIVNAQGLKISGTVTNAKDGSPIPGVSVVVKENATIGTATNIDGYYEITVPSSSTAIVFSSVGMKTLVASINGRSLVDVALEEEFHQMDEVVVTALGISRERKSLGYSVQEVQGDDVNQVRTDNFVNSLSGKVSGVQVRRTTNMGGSTNITIRGNSSLTGNNQALFVVDGVPISNLNTNSRSQEQAGVGYDYGNAASDINPDDIESISVLKGAAASALYGSRAANGVIMITTKKGSKKDNGIGVTINSGITIGSIDKSTFPTYQEEYGGGYGAYYDDPSGFFWYEDITGDGNPDLITPMTEDASYGAPFDKTQLVYQWDAFDSESPNYMTATPWVAAENGPITFFETPIVYSNSIAIDNSFDKGNYRLSYTNYDESGILPNSELKRNSFLMNMSYEITDKLTTSGSANFIQTDALGRNSTGYNDNIMGSMRQWWQVNTDIQDQKDAYFATKRNTTWNYAATDNSSPIYWDNPYWTRYENYESDKRNRFVGNMALNYELTDWLEVYGRVSVDTYNELQEERRNVGSVATTFGIGEGSDGSISRPDQTSGYQRKDITFSEYNYDLMFKYNKDLTDELNVSGVVGTNVRRTNLDWALSATNGGIGVPRLYSLQNSLSPVPYPKEAAEKIGVNGIYGSVSVGYNRYLFVDATLRRDHSSTLPEKHSIFYYPSITGSVIFSEFLSFDWLSFGKLRLNYAEVGNSAGFDQILDTYNVYAGLGGGITSVSGTKKNPDLRPEKSKSLEGGLEMYFLNRRVGFDLGLYKVNTVDQILPVKVTSATGYNFKVINAGEIENKGVEFSLNATPVSQKDFSWNISINYAKNTNEVISLTEGLDNLQLADFQGGVTLNAMVGQPYGVIYGTDYTYLNGEKLVDESNGQYIKTGTSDNVIGNMNPDWTGGISNKFTYKNLSFSFLIDVQKGGDIFSLDMYYGLATGLYDETSYINDLGNLVRNPITYVNDDPLQGYASNSGGFINDGVNEDGTLNETRIRADRYGAFGYRRGLPDKAFVYDASYVKLREVTLTYTIPERLFNNLFLTGASLSFVGSNLWIIHKNLPYADPESGLGSGNIQGYSTGSLPTTRNYGFNIKLQF
jgi:TonB-linked SusC/RagA family outer membrane protein